MNPRLRLGSLLASLLVASTAVVGCRPCEELEARICQDLGPEDCARWKAPPLDRTGLGSDRMSSEMCSNNLAEPKYSRIFDIARGLVESSKNLEKAQDLIDDAKRRHHPP